MDKALVTFEELDSELALQLPERRLLQCNNATGICVNVGPTTVNITNNHVCVQVNVLARGTCTA